MWLPSTAVISGARNRDFSMLTFSSVADAPPPWGDYDFSKPSLVAVASSEHGDLLLAAVGGHALLEVEECGFSHPEDLGLVPPAHGLWVWEGKYISTRSETPDGTEYDQEAVGTWRRPTQDELATLLVGECPWNDLEWKLPQQPQVSPPPSTALPEGSAS